MPSFLHFWGHCIAEGWKFGDGFFDIGAGILALISAAFLFAKKQKRNRWKPWEERSIKVTFCLSLCYFATSTVLVSPFIEYDDAEGKLQAAVFDVGKLQQRADNLQKRVDTLTDALVTENANRKIEGVSQEVDPDIKKEMAKLYEPHANRISELESELSLASGSSLTPSLAWVLRTQSLGLGERPMSAVEIQGLIDSENHSYSAALEALSRAAVTTVQSGENSNMAGEWRPLSDDEIITWVARLSPFHWENVSIAYRDGRSLELGRSLYEVASHLHVQYPQVEQHPEVGPGITIYCSEKNEGAAELARLFGSINFHAVIVKSASANPFIQIAIGKKQ